MHRIARTTLAAVALAALAGTVMAQQPAPPPQPPQFPNMTFFITSAGPGKGADLGGLAGADAHCQALAAKAGAGGKTWRAYLSQQAVGGAQAIHARDRIGKGPWVNAQGKEIAANVDDLHTPEKNRINTEMGVSDNGRLIPSRLFVVNQHDILTGSDDQGRAPAADKDMTCGNWTKGGDDGAAMVGHHDRMGLRDDAPSKSWNASHPSRGCSMDKLRQSGGAGLFYCFAAN
jgi:hypothetical protein